MNDWEYSDFNCPKCGEILRIAECAYCNDGIIDDLHEVDPLWYDEDDTEVCSHCKGDGVFIWCGNDNCNITKKEIKKFLDEFEKEECNE